MRIWTSQWAVKFHLTPHRKFKKGCHLKSEMFLEETRRLLLSRLTGWKLPGAFTEGQQAGSPPLSRLLRYYGCLMKAVLSQPLNSYFFPSLSFRKRGPPEAWNPQRTLSTTCSRVNGVSANRGCKLQLYSFLSTIEFSTLSWSSVHSFLIVCRISCMPTLSREMWGIIYLSIYLFMREVHGEALSAHPAEVFLAGNVLPLGWQSAPEVHVF